MNGNENKIVFTTPAMSHTARHLPWTTGVERAPVARSPNVCPAEVWDPSLNLLHGEKIMR